MDPVTVTMIVSLMTPVPDEGGEYAGKVLIRKQYPTEAACLKAAADPATFSVEAYLEEQFVPDDSYFDQQCISALPQHGEQ